MGQRANLIVVTTSGVELYSTHWRANTLDRDLLFGPEHATAFARAQRSEAEGGAVIDHVRRELLWWGGEDAIYDVPLRRTLLAVSRTRTRYDDDHVVPDVVQLLRPPEVGGDPGRPAACR